MNVFLAILLVSLFARVDLIVVKYYTQYFQYL